MKMYKRRAYSQRERSLALTKLDEALMWANVAIAEAGVADYAQ